MKDVLPRVRVLAASLAAIGAIGFVGGRFSTISATSAALILLMAVLITASFTRRSDAIAVSLAATLALDVFFIPPVGYITVNDPQGWIALLVFVSVSITASHMSHRLRRQQEELIQQRQETEKLHALSRSMLLSGTADEVKRSIVGKCIELFGFRQFILFELATGQIYPSDASSSVDVERLRRVARLQNEDSDEGGLSLQPLTLGNIVLGSIAFKAGEFPIPARLVSAIANTVAVGLAHAQAQRTSGQAEAVRRSEELKSVMIDAMAHDLKSPLTAIEASAEVLADGPDLSPEARVDMLQVIREESRGLRRLIEEAIHLARIDAERFRLESRPVPMRELVDEAVQSLGDRADGRNLTVNVQTDLPMVEVDRSLIVQAIKQLIDNALKYSPPQDPVIISSTAGGTNEVTVSVRDNGPGLTELEQGRVFEKFYRGRYDRSAVQGTGMGLAIAKEIVEAHGGSIGVRSRVGQGSEFFLSLRTRAEWR